jgi:predicted O-methyltransferase YrrM
MRASATTLASEISTGELAALISRMMSSRLRGAHLEIGTAAGGTLRMLMLAYASGQRPRFVVIDPMTYFPDQFAIVRRNLATAGIDPGEVDFRISKSWPAFQAARRMGERFSFMFIDGSHKLHRVTQDLTWTRLLEPGGLLCLHDYAPNMPGVIEAVDRFLARYPNYQIDHQAETLLIVRKTGPSHTQEITRWDHLRANAINTYHQLARGLAKRVNSMR